MASISCVVRFAVFNNIFSSAFEFHPCLPSLRTVLVDEAVELFLIILYLT